MRGVRNLGERCYSGDPREKDLLQTFEKFWGNLGKNLGERCYSGLSRTKFLGVRGVIVNHVSGVIVNHVSVVITNPPCSQFRLGSA